MAASLNLRDGRTRFLKSERNLKAHLQASFPNPGEKEKIFIFNLTATYAGRFYLPGTYCEAMYDNSIAAKDKGMWVEIVRE